MSSGINRDDWLRALDEAGLSLADDQGAVTIHEFAEMFGNLHHQTAWRRLEGLVSAGKAVKTRKFVTARDGRRLNAVAYKLESA